MSKVFGLPMTARQESLYVAKEDEEEIGNPFANNQRKTMPYEPRRDVVYPKRSSDLMIYEIDPHDKYHILKETGLTFMTPSIKVKPEYRGTHQICWSGDLGDNIVINATFEIDGQTFAEFTGTSLKHARQFFYPHDKEKRALDNQSLGNHPRLVNWSTELPRYEIIAIQPWFYSQSSIVSFPLRGLYPGIYANLTQNYNFRLNISELLRIRKLTDFGDWREIPFEEAGDIFEGLPGNGKLPEPTLCCEFIYLGLSTVDYFRDCSDINARKYRVIRYSTHCREDEDKFGDLVNLPLINNNPASALLWHVVNTGRERLNDRSNYLSENGQEVIQHCTLSYTENSEKTLFKDLSAANFYRGFDMRKFPSAPTREGCYGYAFGINPGNLDADSSFEFCSGIGARLKTRLRMKQETEADQRFRLEASIVEIREFYIGDDVSTGPDGSKRYRLIINY